MYNYCTTTEYDKLIVSDLETFCCLLDVFPPLNVPVVVCLQGDDDDAALAAAIAASLADQAGDGGGQSGSEFPPPAPEVLPEEPEAGPGW